MHGFSMTNTQPWAKTNNFEASAVHFEIILKKLCNSCGNFCLSKCILKCLKIIRRFSNFQNYVNNSLKTPEPLMTALTSCKGHVESNFNFV